MTPVPLDLPLRPSEAAELAHLVFEQAERKPLTEELRNRVAARAAVLRLQTIRPWFGSLVRDPVHPSSYYLAVDAARGEPLLLHMAVAAAPTSSIFHKPLLIGRMRRPNGPEMVLNAVPFGPAEQERLEQFAARLDNAFLPRPLGSRMALVVESGDAAAAFEAFRAVWKRTGKNLAAIGGPPEVYSPVLWAAIRAGWREGYALSLRVAAGERLEAAAGTIRRAAAFTRFSIDTSALLQAGEGAWEERFESSFTAEERGWIFDEFARPFDLGDASYDFTPEDVVRLAVEFGRTLQACGRLYETVRQARERRSFDFEFSLERAPRPTTAKELIFCLHWLKARGQAAQLAAPKFDAARQLPGSLAEVAGVCRYFQCSLSLRERAEYGPEVLELAARATVGRLNYVVSGETAKSADAIARLAAQLVG